jgi:hypothetical protein
MIEMELVSNSRSFEPFRLQVVTRLAFLQAEKMEKAVDAVKRNFATIRTGRANAGMLDRIMV